MYVGGGNTGDSWNRLVSSRSIGRNGGYSSNTHEVLGIQKIRMEEGPQFGSFIKK